MRDSVRRPAPVAEKRPYKVPASPPASSHVPPICRRPCSLRSHRGVVLVRWELGLSLRELRPFSLSLPIKGVGELHRPRRLQREFKKLLLLGLCSQSCVGFLACAWDRSACVDQDIRHPPLRSQQCASSQGEEGSPGGSFV